MKERIVEKVVLAQATSDGAGVRLKRSLGSGALDHFDPFLLLDEFGSEDKEDYIGGFPDHPHRGFETVTYMLAGRMEHKDHMGNQGILRAGSVQWMTAGHGIIHSEMPKQDEGLMRGFQLWVNLPAKHKMTAPRYQDIPPENVPEVALPGGGKARVVAGTFGEATGPVQGIVTDPLYLDIHLTAGEQHEVPLPEGHNGLCYCYDGDIAVGSEPHGLHAGLLAVLTDGAHVRTRAGEDGARFLLIAGRPIGEPVARYGPFVMNTREEIVQAVEDYRTGRLLQR